LNGEVETDGAKVRDENMFFQKISYPFQGRIFALDSPPAPPCPPNLDENSILAS